MKWVAKNIILLPRFAFFSQKHRKKEARQTDNTRNVPEMFADKEAIRNGTGRSESERIIN